MKGWKTFDNRKVTFEEMSHQHMSNIMIYITQIVPEYYSNTTRVEVMVWLNKRFDGFILFYRPLPEFKQEKEILIKKGYLKPNGLIVINDQVIGYYKIENKPEPLIPNDAHSFEVFAIKDCEESPTGKQAFIGFKLDNGNFHYIGVPYTAPNESK